MGDKGIVSFSDDASNDGEILSPQLEAFRARVLERGRALYRDLPWRRSRNPYEVWISEVMLQQTQVSRVDGRWQRWIVRFPSIDALASAQMADVLEEWQGLGYNRRALAVWRAAQQISLQGGVMPHEVADLVALPSIGPATAAGIRAFALNLPGVYLETNVRTVFLHELYPEAEGVPDRELTPLVEACCPRNADDPADDPRTWYFALLDYGAWLKRTVENPSRRSKNHVRQKRFEGSHRQKRAMVVRVLLAHRAAGLEGADVASIAQELSAEEQRAGRDPLSEQDARLLLEELASEGFCTLNGELWSV